MKKLTKDQAQQHAQLSTDLHGAYEDLDGAVKRFNEKVAAAYAELEPFVDGFNKAVDAANTFVEQVHDEQQAHFDDRSEKWQEGDAGSEYQGWMDGWELSVEEIELDEPVELEVPDVDIDSFEQLETECPS